MRATPCGGARRFRGRRGRPLCALRGSAAPSLRAERGASAAIFSPSFSGCLFSFFRLIVVGVSRVLLFYRWPPRPELPPWRRLVLLNPFLGPAPCDGVVWGGGSVHPPLQGAPALADSRRVSGAEPAGRARRFRGGVSVLGLCLFVSPPPPILGGSAAPSLRAERGASAVVGDPCARFEGQRRRAYGRSAALRRQGLNCTERTNHTHGVQFLFLLHHSFVLHLGRSALLAVFWVATSLTSFGLWSYHCGSRRPLRRFTYCLRPFRTRPPLVCPAPPFAHGA